MNKTVLDLTAEEMRKFFLDGERYCTAKLPRYFEFHSLLSKLYDYICSIDPKGIELILNEASRVEKVNYKLIINKDGHYAWRKLEIIHPLLYVILVRALEKNWNKVKKRFNQFNKEKSNNIICVSIPPLVSKQKKESYTKTTILNWWERVEQQSLKLALEYSYLINTDITDCYGSLYTHSIPWALMKKKNAKNERKKGLGNTIDKIIRSMNNGQTNGIPAGSVLMDFIAEIVLGYIDTQLVKKIIGDKTYGKTKIDYKIIRYRDDYKIFVHNPTDGERILKNLSEVLIDFGFKLNNQKTFIEDSVINGAIKKDKLDIILSPFDHQQNLQNQLIFIYNFGRKHVNSGQMIKLLSDYRKKLKKWKAKIKNNEGLIDSLISISVNIAYETPKAYPVCFGIISELIDKYDGKKIEKAKEVIKKVRNRFANKINNDYLDIWMQRLSYKLDPNIDKYKCNLCKIISAKEEAIIWESSWLSKINIPQGKTNLTKKQLKLIEKEIKLTINWRIIKDMPPVISANEVDDFTTYQ